VPETIDPEAVTRVEVIDHVAGAFEGHPVVTTADLLEAALRTSARPAVLGVIESLPDRKYERPQDLWSDLPHLAVGE
jgi:hypothetical protein